MNSLLHCTCCNTTYALNVETQSVFVNKKHTAGIPEEDETCYCQGSYNFELVEVKSQVILNQYGKVKSAVASHKSQNDNSSQGNAHLLGDIHIPQKVGNYQLSFNMQQHLLPPANAVVLIHLVSSVSLCVCVCLSYSCSNF